MSQKTLITNNATVRTTDLAVQELHMVFVWVTMLCNLACRYQCSFLHLYTLKMEITHF